MNRMHIHTHILARVGVHHQIELHTLFHRQWTNDPPLPSPRRQIPTAPRAGFTYVSWRKTTRGGAGGLGLGGVGFRGTRQG